MEVRWVDILEEPNGDPSLAKLARRTSYGVYWEEREDDGLPVLVTTTTLDDPALSHQQGYCIYPRACIVGLKVVKRSRRGKGGA